LLTRIFSPLQDKYPANPPTRSVPVMGALFVMFLMVMLFVLVIYIAPANPPTSRVPVMGKSVVIFSTIVWGTLISHSPK
jgi:apolipoprotein N-acyltransferase